MNYNNKNNIKNIIANMFLVIAMSLSLIGGAFLLAPQRNVRAAEVVNGKPDDIKWATQITSANSKYDVNNGFQSVESNFNYVNVKDVVYYVYDSKLYTDSTHRMQSKDLSIGSVDTDSVKDVKKRTDTAASGVDFGIYKDRFSVEYNGMRYFLKNGVLYEDLACTKTSSLIYEVVYTVNGITTLPSRVTIQNNAYYNISGTDRYIRVDRSNNDEYTSLGGVAAAGSTIVPQNIYIFETESQTAITEGANRYVQFGTTPSATKYYIYNNKLHDNPVFSTLSDNDLDDLCGNKTGNTYSGGIVFRSSGYVEVLYKISTSDTTSATLSGMNNINFVKVENLNSDDDYYLNVPTKTVGGEPVLDFSKYNNKIYTIDSGVATSINAQSLGFTIVGTTEMNNERYLITQFTYSNSTDYHAKFIINSTIYYIINSQVCTQNALVETTLTNGFYKFNDQTRSFSVDINQSYTVTANSVYYYPVDIWGETYYVTSSDPTKLYTISTDADKNNVATEVNSITNCTSFTVSKSNNLFLVTITYDAKYLMNANNLYEVNPISLSGRDSFICYAGTYYYQNAMLYLDVSHTSAVLDFKYDCNIDSVLIGQVYHKLQEATFQYVVIDGKTFYVDNSKLYANIYLCKDPNSDGTESVIEFKEEDVVFNEILAYKVNSSENLITIFNGLTNGQTIVSTGTPAINTVEYGGINYTLNGSNQLVYTKNGKTFSFYDLNIDYTISYNNKPINMTIQPVKDDYSDYPTDGSLLYEFTENPLTSNTYGIKDGTTINGFEVFLYFNKDNPSDAKNGLYYFTGDDMYGTGANLTPENHMKIQVGEWYTKNWSGSTNIQYISNKAYTDYILMDTNNDSVNDTVYFADALYTTSTTIDFEYGGTNYTITKSGNSLLLGGIDLSYKFMEYNYDSSLGLIKVNRKFNVSTIKFDAYNAYSYYESFDYIYDISNDKYYISQKTNNQLSLYAGATLSSTHIYSPDSGMTADYKASELHLEFHNLTTYFDVQSDTGETYKEFSSLNGANIDNDGVALLNNYNEKHKLLIGSASTASLNTLYVGFNEKKGTNAVITSGAHQLTVQAYLNNDYVMKYKDITSSYYVDSATGKAYGVLLDINPIQEEEVTYANLVDNVNVNHYWYDYFNLENLNALIRYDYLQGNGNSPDNNKEYVKEKIEDSTGLYTFVFNFTYISNGNSTQYVYTYSVYITESSEYIEYPTFNTKLTTSIDTSDKDAYNQVVTMNTNIASASEYYYNNQTYDLPIYTYDASKYNVSYDVKYNISQNFYTTDFVLINAGRNDEYGILTLYKNGLKQDTYTITLDTLTDSSLNKYNVAYYTKNGKKFGALCINNNGQYLLSIDDFYYYNPQNYEYGNISNLTAGRIIKNGPQNTPQSYYFPMIMEELGVYTIHNKYIISEGSKSVANESTFRVIEGATYNSLYGTYTSITTNLGSAYNSEILRYASYNNIGELICNYSRSETLSSDELDAFLKLSSTTTFTYFGIQTKFIKDDQEIPFSQISKNIYSDVTPNTTLISALETLIVTAPTSDCELSDCNVPLTNLQPIYFDYYGNFNYNPDSSYYYRFENPTYTLVNGNISSITFKQNVVKKTKIGFTNKTTISAPGFYVVKVNYGIVANNTYTQYFAFAIENSAPNLEIYTCDSNNGMNDKLFMSSTSFSTTTRYTNTEYLKAVWPTPNYFQGAISLSYTRESYDGKVLNSVSNYLNGNYIPTSEGKYTFTIRYGIRQASYTSTYVIVDHKAPDGQMYTTEQTISGQYLTTASRAIKNIFNCPSVFASTPVETSTSGAKVYARISAISFSNFNNSGETDIYNKIIANSNKNAIEAIKTNIQLNAGNSLLAGLSTLDDAPRYNFFDSSLIGPHDAVVSPTQILGNSDQSLIYIIKLYDEAGNYQIYYYIFDKSSPYMVYQILPSSQADILKDITESIENNTTQTNTNIIWGNYKAIRISNVNNDSELFLGLKNAITEAYALRNKNYGDMFFKEITETFSDGSGGTTTETNLYLYVPINNIDVQSTLSIDKISQTAVATTKLPNITNKTTIFVSKTDDVEELNNKIKSHNKTGNFSITIGDRNTQNRPALPSNYYPDFFKGDKNYTFFVTDSFGNTATQILTLNSSVAQETFYLNSADHGYALINPTKQRAYNANQLNVYYKDLEKEEQAFSAKITYDYFAIDFENFLDLTNINSDTLNTYYYQYCYDVETGIVYSYDITGEDGKNFKQCVFNDETKKYEYAPSAQFISFADLPDSAFFPGYPYTISSSNMAISTTTKADNDKFLTSAIINNEDGLTKQGLYVFRRSYINLTDGKEISQESIDKQNDENLAILKDDYAIRYHAFYIDRNKIVDLSYNLLGEIDKINSIGNLLEIYLGRDLDGKQEALITAETFSNYTVNRDIDTNKLKVQTNFTWDKYSTIEKLESNRKYQYRSELPTGQNKTFNELMEDISIATNKILFSYNIDLFIAEQVAVKKNNVQDAALAQSLTTNIQSSAGTQTKTDYSANTTGRYILNIADSSSMSTVVNNEYKENIIQPSLLEFQFIVSHTSPYGTYITKENDDFGSIKQLSVRSTPVIDTSGSTTTFTSSNVENLSFTFTDSNNPYLASVNPYQIKVYKEQAGGNRTTILSTKFNTNNDGSYVDTFSTDIIANMARLSDVLIISGDDKPYTYTINIFDRNSPVPLLSNWAEDVTYIVQINYIGNNPDDYTVQNYDPIDYSLHGYNYYYSMFRIHIDRQAPQNNLKQLVQNDPNIDDYALNKYGKTYYELSNSSDPDVKKLYKELMTSYAFPVRMIENKNLLYYYKKEHPNTTISDSDTLLSQSYADQVSSLYETYGTVYNHDYDDSVKVYTRIIGDKASDYKYSILPSESEYAEGINGHLKFTESADEFYQHNYINEYFNFSTVLKAGAIGNTDENKFFNTNYYEIIEADEAGNLTRYFVYLSDSTSVELDFNYINSDNDTCNTFIDANDELISNNQPLPFYIDYNSTRYYLSNHGNNGEWSLYEKSNMYEHSIYNKMVVKLNPTSLDETIKCSYYFHNNTWESVPTSIIINGDEYVVNKNLDENKSLIYGRYIINSDATDQFINALSLTGIHFIKEYVTESPLDNEKYTFDDFYSVKIYQVSGLTERLIMDPILSDPYIENGSGHNLMTNIVNRFKEFVLTNSNIYTFKFEISNRFSKTPYTMYLNLPDADLDLGFEPTENGNLLVSIPDSSIYNVKITNFSVFYYQDYAWRPLSQDANKKIIQTTNTIDVNAGLPATTYELDPGQYKFFFMDNFQRRKTVYQIVGGTADSRPPEFSFAKPHIQNHNTYTTSGNAVLLVDDNVWKVQVVLKNAVRIITPGSGPDNTDIIKYYALKSFGNSTILCINDNQGGEYKPVYFTQNNDISESGGSLIYYYMGKLFTNEECTTQITIANATCDIRVNTSTRLIYTLGNPVGTRKSYILNPFTKFGDLTIDEYEIITNWITDESNSDAYTTYKVNIDQTQPKLILMTDSGLLEPINGQNYNKPFTITWQSNYNIVSARIIQHVNGRRNEIILDPNGSYDVHTFAGYTLYLTDEIGNELSFAGTLGFSFNFVEIANEYFSIYVDSIYLLPSDYISTNTEDGKTIRYYYYQDKLNHDEEIVIETDQTKNIVCEPYSLNGTIPAYTIKRSNIDYTICYLRLIPVTETNDINNFVYSIKFNYTEESEKESKTEVISRINSYTFEESQDCDNIQLSVYKNLYSNVKDTFISYIGNRVYVDYYYNNTFIKTYSPDSWSTINTNNQSQGLQNYQYTINCSSTGVHRFEFVDSVNNRAFDFIQVTLIKDVMFSVNGENPMDNRIYNGDVVVDVPQTIYYQDVQVTATLNGRAIDTTTLRTGTKYTFSTSGIYEVNMVALNESTGVEYTSTYRFTIINPNVARMTFGFGNDCGFTISKVIKNNADITDQIRAESIDSMWLTSGKPDTVGSYTITLIGFDKLTNEYTPFTFKVRLNNEIPSINAVDFQFGTKTSKPVTIQYNPALIYSQVGESYIFITNNAGSDHTININSESPDGLLSFVINIEGKFNITIYDKDGNFITNYTFTKVAPLNSSAKFIIIIASILVISLVVIFIFLRRHTKFR